MKKKEPTLYSDEYFDELLHEKPVSRISRRTINRDECVENDNVRHYACQEISHNNAYLDTKGKV